MQKREFSQQESRICAIWISYSIKIHPGCRVGASAPKFGGVGQAGREGEAAKGGEGFWRGRALLPSQVSQQEFQIQDIPNSQKNSNTALKTELNTPERLKTLH